MSLGENMTNNQSINKNTYYGLSPYFLGACMSISRATSGRYYLTRQDNKNNNYIVLNEQGITLKVPYRALFDTNDKIKPIVSLSFSDSINCPSAKRGLCQLNNYNMSCYAKNGQCRACGQYTNKGYRKINSLENSYLVMVCLNELYKDIEQLNNFSAFINKTYPIVRFNLKGDFKNEQDLYILSFLVSRAFKTVFYGYSARDDLLNEPTPINGYEQYLRAKNCYLNGSNEQYTNRFKATYDLKEWWISPNKCLGGCITCSNCYTKRNTIINCLVHNKNSDIILNTLKNRVFLKRLLRCYGLNIKNSDLKVKSGLLESLNYYLEQQGINLYFDKFLDLFYYTTDTYNLWDNIEQVDIQGLVALGVQP